MRCVGVTVSLFFLSLAVFVAYYGNNDIPDIIEEKFKYQVYFTMARTIEDFSRLGSYLTSTDGRIFLRNTINTLEQYMPKPPIYGVNVSDRLFDGVRVRVYQGDGVQQSTGGLIYLHGGGFIASSPKGFDGFCAELVRRLNITIASVDYRLAPEHASPAQLEDAKTAVRHLYKHAKEYGVPANKIGVAGDSAGGTLAGSLALYFRDHLHTEGIQLRFQALSYPLLQAVDFNLPSYHRYSPLSPFFTQRSAVAGVISTYITGIDVHWTEYVPDIICGRHLTPEILNKYSNFINISRLPENVIHKDYQRPSCLLEENRRTNPDAVKALQAGVINPYNFPLMADTVAGLPPTFLLTVHSDTIRDDGLLYLKRLQEENVPVVHMDSIGGWHGMITFYNGVKAAQEYMDNITTFISNQLQDS